MLNNKVIVLSGFARGGTNIAWNILQSHPDIVAPPYETGEIFKKSLMLKLLKVTQGCSICPRSSKVIDKILFDYKMKSITHPDNRYCYENVPYSFEQMKGTALCLKSVNRDIYLTSLLLKVYPDLYFIGLTRNGYALADGYVRRGKRVKKIGGLYREISDEMERYSKGNSRFKLIKFEDVVDRPFSISKELNTFLDMNPTQLNKLRFKSKKIIDNDGGHTTKYGDENKKYWVDKDNVEKIIDKNINNKQIKGLSGEMIEEFNMESGRAFDFFQYSKIR